MKAEQLIHEIPKGLIKWYGFERGAHALFVTSDTELDSALIEVLLERKVCTDCKNLLELEDIKAKYYDYIVVADAVEYAENIEEMLQSLQCALKNNGKLFLCVGNRLGIKYFCGDRDPFTGRNFDGIENYQRVGMMDTDKNSGRMYAKAELINMLERAGFVQHRFYSVFSDITYPQILFAEDYEPTEELRSRIRVQYNKPDTIFLEEEHLYSALIENGMFHSMANGFLIECPMDGRFANAYQITISMDRGRENALCTIIRRDGKVEKIPVYAEGSDKTKKLMDNTCYLQKNGIKMVEAEIIGDSFIMPYVEGTSLLKYFRDLAKTDKQEFYRQFDKLWALTQASSEHVDYEDVEWEHFNPWWDEKREDKVKKNCDRTKWRRLAFGTEEEREALGIVLKRGYIDLVLINGFEVDGEYIFFDQELYVKNLPAKAILLRNINFLYDGDRKMQKILPKEELLEYYHITDECKEICRAHLSYFLAKLRNDEVLRKYRGAHSRNGAVLHSNRQRMNYSVKEYQRLFIDIFKNIENRKVYLFGSGNFTKKFLAMYQDEYTIEGIFDNDRSKWGSEMQGIKILQPSILKDLDASTYKVIICIKNYINVLDQVKDLGATNIGIYDTNMEYPRKQRIAISTDDQKAQNRKKYHIGYIAGVFDLFHIGHLNLLRRAKEQCDYLIVGVVTDEGVRRRKNIECIIPFEERLEIVKSCRYVDEAVDIPYEFHDTKDAYLRFQFDVQFSGDDYIHDSAWQEKREFLREHGAELIFFPYTEGISSTMIKEKLAHGTKGI